jgi:hypothetical protein
MCPFFGMMNLAKMDIIVIKGSENHSGGICMTIKEFTPEMIFRTTAFVRDK